MIRSSSEEKPWGQLIMKIIQVVFLLMAIILAGAWSSKGIGFNDLNSGDLRQKTAFEFMIVVCVFAIVWAIISVVVFIFKQDIPPIVVIVITCVIGLFVLISVAVYAAGVHSISQSNESRTLDLNLAALEAACFFGVVGAMGYVGDIILQFIALVMAVSKLGIKKLYTGSCCKEQL